MTYKKTYGVRGILEWQAVIQSGGLKMRVPFTGGSLTAYGVSPATFTTQDTFTQSVIEGSDYYKKGRIILVRQSELEEKQDEEPAEEAELKKVEVADQQEAKEYLVDNCDVKAGTLRSLSSIKQAAKQNGIEFIGI